MSSYQNGDKVVITYGKFEGSVGMIYRSFEEAGVPSFDVILTFVSKKAEENGASEGILIKCSIFSIEKEKK